MERLATFLFSVIFVTVIISQQFRLSFAQQCEVTCSQTSVIRDRPYDELIEIAQNRQWEDEEDFGSGDNGDLFDVIRRYRSKRSQDKSHSEKFSKMSLVKRGKRSPIFISTSTSTNSSTVG